MADDRADEQRILEEARSQIAASDTGERRRGFAYSIELLTEGVYPDTVLRVRARYGTDDEIAWDDSYRMWDPDPESSTGYVLDHTAALFLKVHLDEDLFGSSRGSYYLWRTDKNVR